MLTDVLESTGYQVREPRPAPPRAAMVEQLQPDLIILDLVLPDEDGLVLCSVLKNMANVPILICSGTQRRRDAFLSLKLGADDFIAKPFDVYDLLARVEVLLRRAAQHHAAEPSVAARPDSHRRTADRPLAAPGHPGRQRPAAHADRVPTADRAGRPAGPGRAARRAGQTGVG